MAGGAVAVDRVTGPSRRVSDASSKFRADRSAPVNMPILRLEAARRFRNWWGIFEAVGEYSTEGWSPGLRRPERNERTEVASI